MFGQPLQPLVENLQALLGDVVGLNVVHADLHVIDARSVQPLNALDVEQVSIRYQDGNDAMVANARNDFVEIRMQQGLAACHGDDGGAQCSELIDTLEQCFGRNRFGEVVELAAIGACQVAAAGHDHVCQYRVALGTQRHGNHASLAIKAVEVLRGAAYGSSHGQDSVNVAARLSRPPRPVRASIVEPPHDSVTDWIVRPSSSAENFYYWQSFATGWGQSRSPGGRPREIWRQSERAGHSIASRPASTRQ